MLRLEADTLGQLLSLLTAPCTAKHGDLPVGLAEEPAAAQQGARPRHLATPPSLAPARDFGALDFPHHIWLVVSVNC